MLQQCKIKPFHVTRNFFYIHHFFSYSKVFYLRRFFVWLRLVQFMISRKRTRRVSFPLLCITKTFFANWFHWLIVLYRRKKSNVLGIFNLYKWCKIVFVSTDEISRCADLFAWNTCSVDGLDPPRSYLYYVSIDSNKKWIWLRNREFCGCWFKCNSNSILILEIFDCFSSLNNITICSWCQLILASIRSSF